MDDIAKNIGNKLREAREEKGLTQKDVGDQLGYTPMGISHFEKGIRSLKIADLKKISDYLGKDMSFFLAPSGTFFRVDNNSPHKEEMEKSVDAFERYLEQSH